MREEKLPRVWIREEPWHEEALKNLEVVATDIASNYARRGSHWIEYVRIETHESLLREARAKIEKLEKINDMNLLLIREYQEVIHDELNVYGDYKKISPHDARLIFSQRRMLQGKSGINKATKARKE